jgi:hypothetical protein
MAINNGGCVGYGNARMRSVDSEPTIFRIRSSVGFLRNANENIRTEELHVSIWLGGCLWGGGGDAGVEVILSPCEMCPVGIRRRIKPNAICDLCELHSH